MLFGRLGDEPIELTLDGAELVSASFLDEVVRQLAETQALDRVTFVTGDNWMVQKLGRIAAIRGQTIYTRSPTDDSRRPVSARPVRLQVERSTEKDEG